MPATPSKPKSAGDDRNLVTVDETYVAPGLEDSLRLSWQKHSRWIVGVCVVVALVLIGEGLMRYLAAQKETEIQSAYADAATPDQLKAFITAHPDHRLAGVAELRLADEAFAAGDFAGAQSQYDRVAKLLLNSPLGQRAQLGAAMATLQAGQTAEAVATLKQIADDAGKLRAIRAEAAYTQAAIAADAGHTDELTRLFLQISTIEPNGMWMQRAMALQARQPAAPAATVPAPVTAPAPSAQPSVIFNPSGK